MKVQKINTAGQVTAVISDAQLTNEELRDLSTDIMISDSTVEQVGLLNSSLRPPVLRMMGGELSINGTLAGAFLLLQAKQQPQESVSFYSSGVKDLITVANLDDELTLSLPLSVPRIENDVVYFDGICYVIRKGLRTSKLLRRMERKTLETLCENRPAAGIIFYEENKIQPVVYVKATKTTVWENACGSGSIAFSLMVGAGDVLQPSGEVIKIRTKDATLRISVTAKKVMD